MSFDGISEELAQNVASLGFDLRNLNRPIRWFSIHVSIDTGEIEETGEYDSKDYSYGSIFYRFDRAKPLVLDTIESSLGMANEGILRAELEVFRWLKKKVLLRSLPEKRRSTLTRHGLEEYVSDVLFFLTTGWMGRFQRRLRIVNIAAQSHGTNEYPFLITKWVFRCCHYTSIGLQHDVSNERISSGITRLHTMMGGEGYYRQHILVSAPRHRKNKYFSPFWQCQLSRVRMPLFCI